MNKNYLVAGGLAIIGIYLYVKNQNTATLTAKTPTPAPAPASNMNGCASCSNAYGNDKAPFWANKEGWEH
jgi:hypothetical protein